MPNLVLIRGLPGSGKSTAARLISDQNRWLHYEADMYHMKNGLYQFVGENVRAAHEWCLKSTEIALHNDQSVVVSNTFTTRSEMQRYLDLEKNTDIVVALVIFKCTGTYGSVHNVPENVLKTMAARWQDIDGEIEWIRN